jgi:hypothetical protein
VLTLEAAPARIVLMGVSMGAVATAGGFGVERIRGPDIDSPFASIRETLSTTHWLFFKLPRFTFPPFFLFWFQRFAASTSTK